MRTQTSARATYLPQTTQREGLTEAMRRAIMIPKLSRFAMSVKTIAVRLPHG